MFQISTLFIFLALLTSACSSQFNSNNYASEQINLPSSTNTEASTENTEASTEPTPAILGDYQVPVLLGKRYFIDFENGADSNLGTTPEMAWKHAPGDSNAQDNAASITLTPGDEVNFKGGVEYYGEIKFLVSGSSDRPIVYRSGEDIWGTGPAIISGASANFSGWTQCQSAADCNDNPNFQNIYYITNSTNVSLDTPLFWDKQFLSVAQDPNLPDPFWIDDKSNFYTIPLNHADWNFTQNSLQNEYFNETDFSHFQGAQISLWVQPNVIQTYPIDSYNPTTKTISFTNPNNIYTDRDSTFSILNHIKYLDKAGEYVISPDKNRIYLWPLTQGNPNGHVSFGKLKRGFDIGGQSHITIYGFKIQKYFGGPKEYYMGVGVYAAIEGSNNVNILNNEISLLKSTTKAGSISVRNLTNYEIGGNHIHDNQLNRGVLATVLDNLIINQNHINRVGGTGIIVMDVNHVLISNNRLDEIKGTHANGITSYLLNNLVTIVNNIVLRSNIALTWHGDNSEPQTNLTVYNNIFESEFEVNYAGSSWGSNMDGVNIINNIFYSPGNLGLSLNASDKNNVIKNNIIHGASTTTDLPSEISHNAYTTLSWSQDARYGWSLGASEFINTDLTALFKDHKNYDFSPTVNAPTLGTGVNPLLHLPVKEFPNFDFQSDINGNKRDLNSWSIGPYQN